MPKTKKKTNEGIKLLKAEILLYIMHGSAATTRDLHKHLGNCCAENLETIVEQLRADDLIYIYSTGIDIYYMLTERGRAYAEVIEKIVNAMEKNIEKNSYEEEF